MRHIKYLVTFTTGQTEIVYCFNPMEAKILAQAEQIKKGHDFEVSSLKDITD